MTTINISRTIELPKSSIIDEMSYNVNEKVLEVTFNTGRTYRYSDVPEDVVKELCKTDSVGSYFRANIRDTFEYEEV